MMKSAEDQEEGSVIKKMKLTVCHLLAELDELESDQSPIDVFNLYVSELLQGAYSSPFGL